MSSVTTPSDSGTFRSALVNTGWLTAARLSGDLAGVAFFIAISRRLGVEAVGDYSLAFAVAALVAAVVGLGLEEFGLREYSRLGLAERRALFPSIIGIQVSLLAVILAVGFGYWLLAAQSVSTMLVILQVTAHVLAFQFATMFFIPAFSRQRMFMPALAEFCFRFGSIVVAIGLVVFAGVSLPVAVMPLAIGTLLLLFVALASCARNNGEVVVRVDVAGIRAVMTSAWPIALSTIVYNVFNRAAVVMLSAFRGPAETGLYASALKLYEFGLMPMYLLGVAVFPVLSRSHDMAGDDFATISDKFLRTSLVFGALLAWGLVFVAPALLPIVLGTDFGAAAPATRMMGLVALLAAVDLACLRLMLAMHLQLARLRIQAAAVALNVALNVLLIPPFGLMGAIAATISAQVVMIAWYFSHFARHDGAHRLLATLRQFGGIAAPTLLTAAVAYAAGVQSWLLAALILLLFTVMVSVKGFAPLPRELRELRGTRTRGDDE